MAIIYDYEKKVELDQQEFSDKYILAHEEGGDFKCITDNNVVFNNDVRFETKDVDNEDDYMQITYHENIIPGKTVKTLRNNFYFSYDVEGKLNPPVGMRVKE